MLLATLAILVIAPGVASAWALRYHNPLRDPATGKPLSCPDPFVADAQAPQTGYVLVCTSGLSKDALPIYRSPDLVHWRRAGFVFPRGHQPWWAIKSTGRGFGGRYWAPELYYIQGRWVIYYAAQYDAAKLSLQIPGGGPLANGALVVGDAWANSLSGPWHTAALHYRGQFNGLSADAETTGAAIDPSVVQDPATGLLYLFWSDQSFQIWAGLLSADGLTLGDQIQPVLHASEPFDCDPRDHHCTIEAPEPFEANGSFYVLYSGGSTWDSSYDVGVAESPTPLGPYVNLTRPILRQGGGFYSTGHTSHPIVGPDGKTYILYHARTRPGHQRASDQRYLMLGRFGWAKGWPAITAGSG
ncbi:MAG TPA: family 43 glycosylhydrolase [Solirubrobacteraceae bacterium]